MYLVTFSFRLSTRSPTLSCFSSIIRSRSADECLLDIFLFCELGRWEAEKRAGNVSGSVVDLETLLRPSSFAFGHNVPPIRLLHNTTIKMLYCRPDFRTIRFLIHLLGDFLAEFKPVLFDLVSVLRYRISK